MGKKSGKGPKRDADKKLSKKLNKKVRAAEEKKSGAGQGQLRADGQGDVLSKGLERQQEKKLGKKLAKKLDRQSVKKQGKKQDADNQLFEERKKTIYAFICDELYIPLKAKEIAVVLQIPKSQRFELQEVLDALTQECRIEVSKKGKYAKSQGHVLFGVFTANAKGFGFVTVEGHEEDYYIAGENRNGAVHMDEVQIQPLPSQSGRRKEARVVKVVSHGLSQLVGIYEGSQTFGFVVPDNQKFGKDIFIAQENSGGAVSGHKVVVELLSYGERGRKPEGKVIEVIGHVNDPGTDIMSIVKDFGLPVEFSERILNQAVNVAKDVSAADMAGRKDLRDWQMVTIDGEDAKDLDDAVSCTMEGDNYCLGVHIADVANYVQEHSALDVEALDRGTSVYLVDRVIPMLPHKLSNGICSLNAGHDRLALSCIMRIDKKGKVVSHEIAETVIRVGQRMTYTAVKEILENHDEALCEQYKEYVPMFLRMQELAALLRTKRKKRGSIDFDFPETKIILDEEGKPVEIKPYERNVATDIIEDFMLIANETVAQDFFWQEMPFVYRSHETPDAERIKKLAAFIGNFGLTLHGARDDIHPKELQKILGQIAGTPHEALISRLTLRSMKRARYTVDCLGHFGLATQYYCHFTSPIRRYPDLQIHRIIKDCLRGRMNEKKRLHYEAILPDVAKQSSEMERRADEAERETDKLKKVEYMQGHIGEVFEGVISSITSWGMYVELPNTIEGMVHVTALEDDYYHYDEAAYELVGETGGRRFKLGQPVRVICTGADKFMRTVDFALAQDEEEDDGQGEF